MIVHDSWWSNGSARSTIIDYHRLSWTVWPGLKKTLFGKRVMKRSNCRWEYRPRNHILICFYPVWTSKKMLFSLEREFRKALRDTLMRATWYELLSTMANCRKIVTFLCLGISIITWVIILKQLFASGSWILVIIIQQIVTLSKYGHDALDICHP